MQDLYAQWKGWSEADFGCFSASDERYFGWHLRRAFPHRTMPLRVLELGFGNGRFMGWLRQGGHLPIGVEANAGLVDTARDAGFLAFGGLEELDTDASFDLIAGFDVLEHVPAAELQPLLARLVSRMAPAGRLLLRFPNGESPFGLWMQHGDLTHVHALGLSKVRQICASNGLRLEHSGERLPWHAEAPSRRLGAVAFHAARRVFEWQLRKMYSLPRGLDLSANQLVVLSREAGPQRAASAR